MDGISMIDTRQFGSRGRDVMAVVMCTPYVHTMIVYLI